MRQMGISASGETINEELPKAPPRGSKKKSKTAEEFDDGDDKSADDKIATQPKTNRAKTKGKGRGKTRRQRKRR